MFNPLLDLYVDQRLAELRAAAPHAARRGAPPLAPRPRRGVRLTVGRLLIRAGERLADPKRVPALP